MDSGFLICGSVSCQFVESVKIFKKELQMTRVHYLTRHVMFCLFSVVHRLRGELRSWLARQSAHLMHQSFITMPPSPSPRANVPCFYFCIVPAARGKYLGFDIPTCIARVIAGLPVLLTESVIYYTVNRVHLQPLHYSL